MNNTIADIIKRAEERAQSSGVPYRGVLTPKEAWQLCQHLSQTRLVDVRSQAEWQLVGRVPGALEVELKLFPGWAPNAAFVEQIKGQLRPGENVLFLCRSGARSDAAAKIMQGEGYGNVFNILEGFEGDLNGETKKRDMNGWKNSGLPWFQS